jgi:hypothetical protein
MGAGKQYTKEQEIEVKSISKKPKADWPDQIKAFCAAYPERKYGSVWQKVYAMAGGPATKGQPTSRHKKKKKVKVARKAKSDKPKVPKVYKRKTHRSPLNSKYMTVSSNEVRFPIESIRIEGGELIVTFK